MKYERVESLRIDHDYKIKYVAEVLKCHRDVYARYEKGIRELPVAHLIMLADLYQVSTDYILGLTDNPNPHK